MHHFKALFILVLSSFCFTSCLDIFEDIYLNKDGSGKYSLHMTLGEELKASIGNALDSAKNEETPEKAAAQTESYKKDLEKTIQKLKTVKGISNIQIINDQKNFTFGYEYDFDNLTALNNAITATSDEYPIEKPTTIQLLGSKDTYTPKNAFIEKYKDIIIRTQSSELGKFIQMSAPANGSNKGMAGGINVAYLLQDLNFTTTFHLKENIKAVSNPVAVLDKKKKTVTLHCKPFAPPSKDLNLMKANQAACQQELQIELK